MVPQFSIDIILENLHTRSSLYFPTYHAFNFAFNVEILEGPKCPSPIPLTHTLLRCANKTFQHYHQLLNWTFGFCSCVNYFRPNVIGEVVRLWLYIDVC